MNDPAPPLASDTAPAAPRPVQHSGRQRPLSRSALYDLAETESINSTTFEAALRLMGIRPGFKEWSVYWFHLLTVCGALLLASGVIFFIAWNWNDLHHFIKFGILEAVVAAGVGIAIWRGVRSVAGGAALLAAGLCIGPLLAVFGQTYMSGAHSWELFRAWALMLLPFALLGRQTALWLLVWLTGCVFGFGFVHHASQIFEPTYGLPELILLQLLAVAVWEIAMRCTEDRPGREWLHAIWLPRLVMFLTWALLSTLVFTLIVTDGAYSYFGNTRQPLFLHFERSLLAMYFGGLVLVYLWYRRVRHDLFMLGIGTFSACAMLVAFMIHHELFLDIEVFTPLIWGLIIAGLTAGCGKLLLSWQRAMEEEEEEQRMSLLTMEGSKLISRWQRRLAAGESDGKTSAASRDFFGARNVPMDWASLWQALTRHGVWPEAKTPPPPQPSGAPWYINTLLSIGGWISAILLVAFLGFFLAITLQVNRDFELPLVIGGCIFLGIGFVCSRLKGLFARQFGLASAISGAIAICGGTVASLENFDMWAVPCFIVCAATFPLINNRAYRYITATLGIYFLYATVDSLTLGSTRPVFIFHHGDIEEYITFLNENHVLILGGAALFWALVSTFIAKGWATESRWMVKSRSAQIMPPLLYGLLTAMYGLLITSLILGIANMSTFSMLLPPRTSLGIGSGFGLFVFVALLGASLPAGRPERWICLVCAALTIPAGWFLPGIPLALFGFCISRRSGNRVLFGASAVFLAAYIFYYYYNLEATLLYKSLNLMACGLTLLILAMLSRRFFVSRPDTPLELPLPQPEETEAPQEQPADDVPPVSDGPEAEDAASPTAAADEPPQETPASATENDAPEQESSPGGTHRGGTSNEA